MEQFRAHNQEMAPRRNVVLASEIFGQLETQAQALINAHVATRESDGLSEREPEDNATTALFEGLTSHGHLSRLEFAGDMDEVDAATLRRLLNGWFDHYPPEEKARRLSEIVEELIIQATRKGIVTGELPADTMVITQSNYADDLPQDVATRLGYRRHNRKGFVRAVGFEQDAEGQWNRVIEQVSRSNSNDQSSAGFLQARVGVVGYLSTTSILGSQILATREAFPDGVIDVQRELDQHAGPGIRYGEVVADYSSHRLPLLSYDELRDGSRQRELQAAEQIGRLKEHEQKINERFMSGELSYDQKLEMLHEKRDAIISEICLLDPGYAPDARGELSAGYFRLSAEAIARGDHEAGQRYLASAIYAIDPDAAPACGGIGIKADGTLNALGKNIYNNAKESRKNWPWKKGICIVKKCVKAIKKELTDVGPCSVCKSCQNRFDAKDAAVPA
jgi:hypothetical protein